MKMDNAFKTALLVGIAVGVGVGYLALDAGVRAQMNKAFRKGMKMAKRQTRDIRNTANDLMERGEKELRFVAHKGRRIYREVAS
jgi:ribosomal protein S5